MKIVICCNHSYPHIGGSEKIIQQIAESMVRFGHKCTILSLNLRKEVSVNGVSILPCNRIAENFLKQINRLNPDSLFVYSDCFLHWHVIVNNAEKICANKSIALVGMNTMLAKRGLFKKFKEKSSLFTVITHSDNYQDYLKCSTSLIPVNVINNGLDLSEIDNRNDLDFRKKYNINTKYMVLCVSNFFPDKGQLDLVKILNILSEKRKDFTGVFISSSINYYPGQIIANETQKQLRSSKFKSLFLKNIGRDYTLAAFAEADVFAFPSKREVAPIVILESMASSVPWVSLVVGNIPSLQGGICVQFRAKDKFGNAKYDESTYGLFADSINRLLESDDFRKDMGRQGRIEIETKYNWAHISEQYNEVFTRCNVK